jgi:ANTAR domain
MAGRVASGGAVPLPASEDLDAFFRHRDDVPDASPVRLISALSLLRGSDDPVVTFARLARACVPEFADACQVELSDGAQPPFRVTQSAGDQVPADAQQADPDQVLLTPFRVVSRLGYPSYAGVVSHWWAGRAPSETDAVLADLIVKHSIALVEQERLLAAVGRAEDRAASLALESISGRAISLATGIVMHERDLSPDEAEEALRHAAAVTGTALGALAARVVRSRDLAGHQTGANTVSEMRRSAAAGRPRR